MSDHCPVCGETVFDDWDYCPACQHPYDPDDDADEDDDLDGDGDDGEFFDDVGWGP